MMCKNPTWTNSTVEHYYNSGYSTSRLDPNNPSLGLYDASITVSVINGLNTLTCRFSRDNSNPNPKYFDLNTNSPYVLAAYGTLNENGGIAFLSSAKYTYISFILLLIHIN